MQEAAARTRRFLQLLKKDREFRELGERWERKRGEREERRGVQQQCWVLPDDEAPGDAVATRDWNWRSNGAAQRVKHGRLPMEFDKGLQERMGMRGTRAWAC